MNVLIVTAVFPPEPVVSSMISFDIAKGLAESGHDVTVICPSPTRPLGYDHNIEEQTESKFRKIVLSSYTCPESKILGRFRESYSFGIHCRRYLARNYKNIGIIYANTWPLFAQFFLVRAANKYDIPVVLHIQDIYPESFSEKQSGLIRKLLYFTLLPFDKLILKNCSKIVAISTDMKDYLVRTRKLDSKKVSVVRNWQNDEKFLVLSSAGIIENSDFTFMYLGSISPSASVITLINAFGKAKLAGCRLVIAGEGSEKVECIRVSKKFPEAKIEFISATAETVPEIQQQADVLLLPLKRGIARTASPSKLTAYMFSGKPIIACIDKDSDTARCILEAGCGFVLEPENEEELAVSMREVIKIEKSKLSEYGMNSRSFAISNMSKKSNLEKITSIILQP